MARLSYGDMERTHGLPLTGPGLAALELGTDAVPAGTVPAGATAGTVTAGATVDPAAEPTGYLVAMDGGVRIHFLDWGGPSPRGAAAHADVAPGLAGAGLSPPGILLIHGLARTAWSWAPVARRLRADAHVAAMDLRGHGLSDAPTDGYDPDQLAEDAIAVAEGAGLLSVGDDSGAPGAPRPQPFVVAGHGYGAVVAAWAANALGDRCAGLVLVDGGWTDLAAETQMTPDEWLAAIAEPPEVLRSMAAWLADREAFDPVAWGPDQERAARAEVVETAAGRVKLAIHRHALAASVGALWTFDPAAVLPAVEAEIIALVARDNDEGRHLGALREVAATRAATGRSPVRAASFPGLGHDLPRHVPDLVAAAIRVAAGPGPGAGRPRPESG
jgi:pimeloyl-ACP methyl ester carboxylesterase